MAENNEPSQSLKAHRIWATYCTTEQLSFQFVRFGKAGFSLISEWRQTGNVKRETNTRCNFLPCSEQCEAIARDGPVGWNTRSRLLVLPTMPNRDFKNATCLCGRNRPASNRRAEEAGTVSIAERM